MRPKSTGLDPQNARKRPASWEEIPVYEEGVNLPVVYRPEVIDQRLVTRPAERTRPKRRRRAEIDTGMVFAVMVVVLVVAICLCLAFLVSKLIMFLTYELVLRVLIFGVVCVVLYAVFSLAPSRRHDRTYYKAPPRHPKPSNDSRPSRRVITNVFVEGQEGDVITNVHVKR